MNQHERPGPSDAWKAAHPDAKVSGGQLASFQEGWAKNIISSGESVHFFKRDSTSDSVIADQLDFATALCGVTSSVRWLYGPGNYDRCTRCQQKWQKSAFRNAR